MIRTNRFKTARQRLTAALWLAGAFAGVTVHAADADVPDASPAERLMFMKPHLAGMQPPQVLRYDYLRETPQAKPVTDRMTLNLERGADGACCAVRGAFMNGEQGVALPVINEARSNPMLLYYLEYEVRQMQRSTKGAVAHFRKQLRQAFVDAATVVPVTVSWKGQEVQAQEVRIEPYLKDPYRQRFEREATKQYAFVLSDDVPGGVYQIHTLIPGAQPGDAPVLHETLTLAEPSATTPAKK